MAVDWVLQHELTDASRDVTPLSYTDVLEYFYYGGLAFAKLGNFEKAVEFFEVVSDTAPLGLTAQGCLPPTAC